jgi:hypothetical protein
MANQLLKRICQDSLLAMLHSASEAYIEIIQAT